MSTELNLSTVTIPDVDFEGIESIVKEHIHQVKEEQEDVEFDFNEEQFNKGVERGSYFAGVLASMLSIGVPAELAVDVLINDEQIIFNKEARAKMSIDEIIREEIDRA